MTSTEAIGLTKVAQNFPVLGSPIICRDNILDTLDQSFASGLDLVVLEGPDGAGKTTIAAQFAERHAECAICLFLRSTSRWGYDPELVKLDLSHQMALALRQELPEHAEYNPDALLSKLLYRLQGQARRSNKLYYFVVDGLHDIPSSQAPTKQLVWNLLPIGLPGFRFVVTHDPANSFDAAGVQTQGNRT
jgi:ATP/maltotriose-dependent transcriptional regulator MalT